MDEAGQNRETLRRGRWRTVVWAQTPPAAALGGTGNNLASSLTGVHRRDLIDSRGATLPDAAGVEIFSKACTEDLAIHELSATKLCFLP